MSKPQFKFSITYDLTTPESSEIGDFAESGFEVEPRTGSLENISGWICRRSFNAYIEVCGKRLTAYEPSYCIDYGRAIDKQLALHIEGRPSHLKRIATMLNNGSL